MNSLPEKINDRLAGWQARPAARRWLTLLIILFLLFLMAFYQVTDPSRLSNDVILAGADYAGYAICHRITERSFTIAGRQVPLCARCTGMYLGVSLTFMILAMAGRQRRSDLPPLPVLLVLVGFVGAMGIDGVNSYSHFFPDWPHLYEPRNWLRLVTGMGVGLAMGVILFPALAQTLWRQQERRPSVASLWELEGLVVAALLAVILVLSNQPAVSYVMALISAAGVVLVLTAINSMTLLIILRKDARAQSWRQATLPLAVGLALALLQIGAASALRYALTGTMTGFPGL